MRKETRMNSTRKGVIGPRDPFGHGTGQQPGSCRGAGWSPFARERDLIRDTSDCDQQPKPTRLKSERYPERPAA